MANKLYPLAFSHSHRLASLLELLAMQSGFILGGHQQRGKTAAAPLYASGFVSRILN